MRTRAVVSGMRSRILDRISADVNRHRNDILPVVALALLGSLAFVRLMALPAFEDEGSQLHGIWRLIDAGEWLQNLRAAVLIVNDLAGNPCQVEVINQLIIFRLGNSHVH